MSVHAGTSGCCEMRWSHSRHLNGASHAARMLESHRQRHRSKGLNCDALFGYVTAAGITWSQIFYYYFTAFDRLTLSWQRGTWYVHYVNTIDNFNVVLLMIVLPRTGRFPFRGFHKHTCIITKLVNAIVFLISPTQSTKFYGCNGPVTWMASLPTLFHAFFNFKPRNL
jgi:hypothetical protein